jgi:hypothetical protein
MLERILTLGSILAMGFGVLIWAQTNFVAASDFMYQQYKQVNENVQYLEDKKFRLDNLSPPKKLEYEDQRKLQRGLEERDLLKQQIKN